MRRICSTTTLFILLFFAGMTSYCYGQIVNIESARMQSDTVGWQGNMGAAFSFTQNTQKIFNLHLGVGVQYKTSNDKGLWLFLGNLGILKVSNSRFLSDNLVHIRYNYKINDIVRWEVFAQHQNNEVTQIDSRILVGTGPRFKLIKRAGFRMYAASLIMLEKEKERTVPVVKHNNVRNSSYISFTWLPRSNIDIVSTTYFQPRVDKLNDFRAMNQTSLTVDATPHFGLTVGLNYLYDKFPAGTAPHTTYTFATGLSYKL